MTPNITDEQGKQIEKEAIEFANKEWGDYDGAGLFNKANWKVTKDDYAAGATKYATLCRQKDEEIARLRSVLEIIAFPLIHLQKLAKEQGVALNGQYAISISNDANWLKNQTIEALKPIIS